MGVIEIMKKILFLCHGAGNGGAERVITTLASEFAKKGYKVLMVTTNEDKNDYEMDKSVLRHRIISLKGNSVARSVDRVIQLRKCMKDFNADTVISFSAVPNMQAIIAAIGMKINIIISERTDPRRYPTSKLGRVLRSFLYPFADTVVFQTSDAKACFGKIVQKKSHIILNPIRDGLPRADRISNEKKIVGIGSLGEQKNWPVALKAAELFMREFSDYTFEIFGEGPDRQKLQAIIDNSIVLKDKVVLKGFSSNAVNELLKASMYVSSSDYEGISNSMLEALAVGIPVICTNCPIGGAKMMINSNQNGVLVPVGDYKKMYEAMKKIATDKKFSQTISDNAILIRDRLKLSKIVDEWEALV